MQPKNQLKFQYIGIFEEIDSFYWPKMHSLKKGQKILAWVDPSPPHLGNARKKTFFGDVFPQFDRNVSSLQEWYELVLVNFGQLYFCW